MKKNKAKIQQINKKVQSTQQGHLQCLKKQGNGYILTICAKPNSKSSKITQINAQYIGVSIAAPPKQGQANEELVNYIASLLTAKKSSVYVDKGGKSRNKIVIVQQCKLTYQEIMQRLKNQI